MAIIRWLKLNWLAVVLGAMVIWLSVGRNQGGYAPMMGLARTESYSALPVAGGAVSDSFVAGKMMVSQSEPAPDNVDRMVARESSLSMKVDDVRESISSIEEIAKKQGGFMVNSSLSKPEEAASGSIVVRVPAKSLKETLEKFRNLGVKVVSESVYGSDITDQYYDSEARLATLLKTKQKFEEILDTAKAVNDLLNVQRELVNLQAQIDGIKGQQKYLEQAASTVPVSIYLSTDEFSLPYAPATEWRPGVVFKEAVRSLVLSFRSVANGIIWLGVYALVWVPLILLLVLVKKYFVKK